jgi:hypothetical protein
MSEKPEKIGGYLFWMQMALYAYVAANLVNSWWHPTLGPTFTGFNMIYATWMGLHSTALLFLLMVGVEIRLRLPKTVKGFTYSAMALIFVTLAGETIFMPLYAVITGDWANVGYLWVIGRIGTICLWAIVILTRTWKMFNLKVLALGVAALYGLGYYWVVYWGFVLWRSPATGDLHINEFMGHWFTIAYYAIWTIFFILAFKDKMPPERHLKVNKN